MSWMSDPGSEALKKELKKQTKEMAKLLEAELRKLKVKAVRCAKNCLQTKTDFKEALQCERVCLNSIKHMKSYIDTKALSNQENLKNCLTMGELRNRGSIFENDSNSYDWENCHRSYKEAMMKAQGDILVEFSYFE